MKLTQLFQTTRISRTLLIAAFALLGNGALKAANFFDNTISGINLGNASGGNTLGHKTWAIFALSGGVTISETNTDSTHDVRGNIGIAGTGTLTLSKTEIKGTAYGANASAISNSGGSFYDINTGAALPAQTVLNNTLSAYVTTAAAHATTASTTAKNIAFTPANTAFSVGGSVSGAVIGSTYTAALSLSNTAGSISAAAAGTYVLKLKDLILSGAGAVLTLNGNGVAGAVNYVINVSRYLTLSNSSQIVLGGGLTAQNVLFNVTNADTKDVNMSGGAKLSGIILAPNRKVSLSGDSTVFGEVIAKTVSLSGSSNVFNPLVSP